MKWTNKIAFDLFGEFTKEFPKNAKIGVKCDKAATQFIKHCNGMDMDHRTFSMKFKRLLEAKPGNKSSAANMIEWENGVFFEQPAPDEKKTRGRPSKTLADAPCLKKRRSILNEAVMCIENFANEQKLSNEEALRMVVEECNRTWHTDIGPNKCTIPDDDAVAMIYNINLSSSQYQMFRTLCLPHNVIFPTRKTIDAIKKKFHPTITSHQLKASVEMTELIDQTATSLVNMAKDSVADADLNGSFLLVGKFGVDGSGSHKIRQQLIDTSLAAEETPHLDPTKANSFVLSCYCPLELHYNDMLLWSNPVPNSNSFARPVSLTRTIEDRDVLAVELESSFSLIRNEYKSNVIFGDSSVVVNCKTECSMIDGKMVTLLQGDSGTFCHLCHASRADANNTSLIEEGFEITKDYDSCTTAWDKLCSNEITLFSIERQG